jgi:hypothetical protein
LPRSRQSHGERWPGGRGITDGDFVGTMTFDSDGDFVANGTLTMQKIDCSTLVIP